MATLNNPFDASTVDPTMGGRAFPVGRHKVILISSDAKPTQKGDGGLAEFVFRIIEGGASGFEGIGDRLNLWNPNQQAVDIAHKRLSSYCHVTGQLRIQATEQLHNIPFYAEWAPQKDEEAAKKGYTELVKMWDVNGNEPGKQNQQPAQQQTTQGAQSTGGGNAWPQGNGQAAYEKAAGAPSGQGSAWQQPQQQQTPPANTGGNAWPGAGGGGNTNAAAAGTGKAPWQK